jgi:hypothetical protein
MQITSAKKKNSRTKTSTTVLLKHFERMLPLFSPAQLTSTDPKPAPLPSLPKPMLRICKSHQLKQKKQTRTLNKRAMKFFECALPVLSPVQLTLNNPQSGMPEISRRSHSFEQKK